jgi:hypothetical protein
VDIEVEHRFLYIARQVRPVAHCLDGLVPLNVPLINRVVNMLEVCESPPRLFVKPLPFPVSLYAECRAECECRIYLADSITTRELSSSCTKLL